MRLGDITGPRDISVDGEYGTADGYVIGSDKEQLPNWLSRNGIHDSELVEKIRSKYRVVALFNNINVDEDARGQGHGNDLMEEFIENARLNDAEAIFLISDTYETQAEGFDLVKWYAGWGFEKIVDTGSGPLMMLEI